MRGKSLPFDHVYDVRAMRITVATVPDCYGALSWVHNHFAAIPEEFDDYIAKPKVNGYQSLHTVVRDAAGQPTEIQIRTQAMHDHAENGVAAHWAYKEAGAKGYAGVSATGAYDAKIAVLRQLLAWERDLSGGHTQTLLEDRIYVLTPEASIVELPQGSTAIDFAYTLHTDLGHRCRGARVDGAMVPLHTPLKNGQTVEINAAKEGGPSRDWLNAELGYMVSHRAKTKVRAWFNALALSETIAKGREVVEKLLQREGKTAVKLDDLATQLGFDNANALFEDVGKDTFSLRQIELLLRPNEAPQFDAEAPLLRKSRSGDNPAKGGLLVVGVDSLMTQMAKCCKPAPPDAIVGFVTRGKGVSVHRKDCSNLAEMVAKNGERLIEVEWGLGQAANSSVYPVDVAIIAQDRQGLLRDISEVFTKEKMNVTGVQTQSIKGIAWMTFTVEVSDSSRLHKVLAMVLELPGVRSARRK
jgi:GTP pyrophosphokinase